MKQIDLHTHTYFSDGLLSPTQLIELAKKNKLSAISITDHDTIDGLFEGKKACEKNNIEFINGTELYSKETEILGYFFDENDSALNTFLEKQIEQKEKHAIKKVDALNDLNIDIEIEDVYEKVSPGRTITDTHIAEIIMEKGYAPDMQEVFKRYMFKAKVRLDEPPKNVKQAIKVISNAGGVCVLPHPWYLKPYIKENLDLFLIKLMKYGLSGIETTGYIPEELKIIDDKNFIEETKELAEKLDLVQTGGSDFHSEKIHPHNILGKYNIPYSKIDELKKRIK